MIRVNTHNNDKKYYVFMFYRCKTAIYSYASFRNNWAMLNYWDVSCRNNAIRHLPLGHYEGNVSLSNISHIVYRARVTRFRTALKHFGFNVQMVDLLVSVTMTKCFNNISARPPRLQGLHGCSDLV